MKHSRWDRLIVMCTSRWTRTTVAVAMKTMPEDVTQHMTWLKWISFIQEFKWYRRWESRGEERWFTITSPQSTVSESEPIMLSNDWTKRVGAGYEWLRPIWKLSVDAGICRLRLVSVARCRNKMYGSMKCAEALLDNASITGWVYLQRLQTYFAIILTLPMKSFPRR